jgi:hypothetical protein
MQAQSSVDFIQHMYIKPVSQMQQVAAWHLMAHPPIIFQSAQQHLPPAAR